jgi:beta-mannosidase
VDRVARRQGLRTVRLVEEDQGEGRVTYVFELNGVRFFARGMNWTPADCYHALGEGAKHDRLLEMSRQMNLNMLRVWGGGIFEPDAWFEKCDELGIMVYQDFMMSCALYPLHPDFLEIMRVEAEAIVRKLRNFACLGLWSGDNENDVAYWDWFGERQDVRDNLITRGVLPAAIDAFDGTRDYVPSSPYSPDPTVHAQDQRQGDTHVWHHGTPFEDAVYTQDLSRFVSEIGHLSCPALETMQSFFSPQSLWPNENSVWDHHIGCHEDLDFMPARRKAMDDSIIAYFGEKPKDVETYVLASQICQGEAYKLWTEHYRQRKTDWESAGILLWNVADCWPQISDAVIDYYLRPKLACNYVRWACQPVLVSFLTAPEGGVSVHVCNDTLEALSCVCRVTEMLPGGEAGEVVEQMVEVPANGALVALDVTKLASEASARGARLLAELVVGDSALSSNRLRFSKPSLAELPLIVADLPAF